MCGIFGFSGKCKPEAEAEFRTFMEALAVGTQARGRHATGIAAYMAGEKYLTAKGPVAAEDFIKCPAWAKSLKARALIGHCRYATHGNPVNNENNHPFEQGRWALIHNGVILGHREIAKKEEVKLTSECDSEVILRVIAKGAKGGEPKDGIQTFCDAVDGRSADYAIALMDRTNGHIRLVRDEARPIAVLKLPVFGVVFFASTSQILQDAMDATLKAHPAFPLLDEAGGWECSKDKIYLMIPGDMEVAHEAINVRSAQMVLTGVDAGGNLAYETACSSCLETTCICEEIERSKKSNH